MRQVGVSQVDSSGPYFRANSFVDGWAMADQSWSYCQMILRNVHRYHSISCYVPLQISKGLAARNILSLAPTMGVVVYPQNGSRLVFDHLGGLDA